MKLSPVIGVAKIASVRPVNSNSYDVAFTFTIENLGNTVLNNISLYDALLNVFSVGVTYSLKVTPQATGSLVINPLYNGSTDINLLSPTLSSLPVGAKEKVTMTLNVVPNGATGIYYNGAAAYGSNPENTLNYSDLSTNGTVSDPNGNGNPNDANENIVTPVVLQTVPILGIANEVSEIILKADGTYDIRFRVTLKNYGNEGLKDIKIRSDLSQLFPAPIEAKKILSPTISGNLVANANYNGFGDALLTTAGTLDIGESQTITYSINVTPHDVFGVFLMQTSGTAIGVNTLTVTNDLSNNGSDPDDDGDGHPDNPQDNEQTPVVLLANPVVKLTLLAGEPELQGDCTYNVAFTLSVKNNGNATLTGVRVTDNLSAAIQQPASYTILSMSSSNPASLNANFNGNSDIDILTVGSFAVGSRIDVTYTINITPDGFHGPFTNSAVVSAIAPDGVLSADSHNQEDIVSTPTPTEFTLIPRTTFIPQAFSPNGDGQHDVFEISSLCGLQVSLSVFNRWGDRVYFNGNYLNDWNGTSNQGAFLNKLLPDGTYFYTVEFSDSSSFTNFLTIKR